MSRLRALVLVLFHSLSLALGVGGCAHQAEAPSATLAAFGAAMARGDYRGAYALTSSAYRARTSYEAFAAGLAAECGGGKGLRGAGGGRRAAGRAAGRIPLELGDTVPLVLEQGRWLVDGPAFDVWGRRRRGPPCARWCAPSKASGTTSSCGSRPVGTGAG